MDDLGFLNIEFFGNTVQNYIISISIVVLGLIFKGLISSILRKFLFKIVGDRNNEEGKSEFDNLLKKPITYFLFLLIIYLASNMLSIPDSLNLVSSDELGLRMFFEKGFLLLLVSSIIYIVLQSVEYVGLRLAQKAAKTESKVDDQLIPFAIEIAKVLVVIFGVLIILGNIFGIDITALAAGLGIGGVAVALASKESLENLLGSFTIFFDKPFTVGDIITIGGITGVVEKVGFRSTRIRTFDKSLVSVPNKKMVDAELDNLGKRNVRRVKFYLGLTYDTKIDQIKKIVSEIENLIKNHRLTTENCMVKFQEFGASSLDILIVYFVNSPDWEDLTNVKQEINFEIMNIVKSNNSDFAFPSTTVYLEK